MSAAGQGAPCFLCGRDTKQHCVIVYSPQIPGIALLLAYFTLAKQPSSLISIDSSLLFKKQLLKYPLYTLCLHLLQCGDKTERG